MFAELAKWSQSQYSYLPWRQNRTLYNTLVSEMMLQQTTVATVLNHFERFIKKYPNIQSLAIIDEQQILKDWKGLGYYRRAKNLLNVAKQILGNYDGEIPLCYETLTSIKGIGPYTANAILAIGANQNVLALDANLERVLSRYYGINAMKGAALYRTIQNLFMQKKIALMEINLVGGRAYNEALMDLGRAVCKSKTALCELCVIKDGCVAFKEGDVLKYPQIPVDQEIKKTELSLLRVIVEKDGKVLVYKKSNAEWLSGQYEIPTFALNVNEENFKQYPFIDHKDHLTLLPSFKSFITHYKITNYVLHASIQDLNFISTKNYCWQSLYSGNLSTSSYKSINLI